jgi:hypothetical protein
MSVIMAFAIIIPTMIISPEARNTSDNVHFGPNLWGSLFHYLSIDMSNAPDKTKIPNVTFSVEVVEVTDYEKWGIGEEIPSTSNWNNSIVEKGNTDGLSIHVSNVVFNENNQYYEEIGQYLGGDVFDYENTVNRLGLFDALLNYGWGELLTDNNSERAIFREPTPEEKADAALMQLGRDNNWPEDTIAYRFLNPSKDVECLYNYDFNTFRYTQQFGLQQAMSVTYLVSTINRDIIMKQTTDGNGNYLIISKSMFTAAEIETLLENILEKNPFQGETKLYRFILKQTSNTPEGFEINQQEKILDVVIDSGGVSTYRIFDTLQQANSFYADNEWEYDISYHTTEFINYYKLPADPDVVPPTGDNLNKIIFTTMLVVSVASLVSLTILKVSLKRKEENKRK